MNLTLFCVGLTLPLMFLTASIGARGYPRPASAATKVGWHRPAPPLKSTPPQRLQPHWGNDPVDLYGNEITTAVSQYRVDARGDLYELRAPHVEIPKLASPKS